MTDIIIFAACAFLVTIARYMGGFRELHMLQQNSYQFKSHFNRAKQNHYVSYLPYVIFLCVPGLMLSPLFEMNVSGIIIKSLLIVASVITMIINKPKKFKIFRSL